MSSKDRDRAITLVDFEPDILASGDVRLDLRVAFKYIAVRSKGFIAHADFYIGCTSASVQLDVEGEEIKEFTQGMELTVNYRDVERRTRDSKACLEPSFEFKVAETEAKVAAGSVSLESGHESVFERSFAFAERFLAAVDTGRSVIWRLDPPTQAQAVRDFLFCNLHLYAVVTSTSGENRGKITVRPADVRFYGPDRRPYSDTTSLLLLYQLWRARRLMFRPHGVEVAFRQGAPQ